MDEATKKFYLKNTLWIFFCLGLAPICNLVNTVIVKIRASENETAAVQAIFTIRKLQSRYAAKHNGKFAADFQELVRTENLDEHFAGQNPVVNGYIFTMKVEEPSQTKPAFYSVNADPQGPQFEDQKSGRHFYYDSVRQITKATEENRPARADDPTI